MSKTIVTLDNVYADGSGAPATVLCQGYYFAADFVGEVRLTSLVNRKAPRRVIESARRQYLSELRLRADANWFDLNRTMYEVR
jgi:hypothetical protein